jgi:putative ATP-dependent endonuclease of OLD family
MSKIHTLEISNFRGLKSFSQVFGLKNFICLIGRGDSGKTTILDAISAVLSPSWNLSFYDTDFYEADVTNPITIETTLYDVPVQLLKESKFGLFIRGLDKNTSIIHDELDDHHIPALTIRLIVESDLEPKWYVVNGRQEGIEIRGTDRATFNVFLVSEYLDRHFSWNKGNPLYSLLRQGELEKEKRDIFIDAFREAKAKIDLSDFSHLENVVKRIKGSAQKLGIDIGSATTTIDFKDIIVKDGRICLHENKIPFRLKGKGSKRLISIAIQMELANNGGILLIDEIEQGLEPDRAQHVANYLKQNNAGQIFMTTHSSAVLVELDATDLYKVIRGGASLLNLTGDLQGVVRKNPEAFFAERILVCEGLTEIGICRALNKFRMSAGKKNAALKGIRIANGSGSTLTNYAIGLKNAGFNVGLFCDSDVKKVNEQKLEMKNLGIDLFDTEDQLCIEDQIFKDLPWEGVKELVQYHIKEKDKQSVLQSITSKYGQPLGNDWLDQDNEQIRSAIAKAACITGNEWFKRTDHGEFIGDVCLKYLSGMKACRLKTILQDLTNWFGND